MNRRNFSSYLLSIGVVAFIFVFGVMTLIAGGGNLILSAKDAYVEAEGNVFNKIKAGINAVDAEYNLVFYRKYDFVRVNGKMRNIMGKQLFPEGSSNVNMVKLNDGILATLKTGLDLEVLKPRLVEFKNYLDGMDIPLVFVYVPSKVLDPEHQLPLGATDSSNADADRFMEILDEVGIDSIDTRKTLLSAGLKTTDLFYATDMHWTVRAAYESFCALANKLNTSYGFHIDEMLMDINNFDVTTYENYFLGSYGRTVGAAYAGLDNFDIYQPKFATDLKSRSVTEDGVWEEREGSFDQSVLYMDKMEKAEGQEYSEYCYNVYGYNRAEVIYENQLVKDGKLLVIKNSAGNPVTDFLALGVKDVCGLDRRALSTSTIADYIAGYKPEAVVIIYNYDFLKEDRLNFFKMVDKVEFE